MADNVQLNAGAGGDVAASDDVGGIQFQRIKLTLGADGVNDGDVHALNPMPVSLTGIQFIFATPTATFGSQQISGSVVATLSGINFIVATQGGTWTVAQGAGGASPWPVSLATTSITNSVGISGNVGATQSGTWFVYATQSGSYGVSGNVGATQSGAWTVGLTGTNFIIATPTGSQQISGSVAATLSGTNFIVATDSGSGKTLKVASISLSATGTVVPAVASQRIKVYAAKLVCGAALTVNWRDGASLNLEGGQAYAINGGSVEAVNPPAFLFQTTAGNSLDLVITGVGSVGGRVSYWDNDAT